MVVEINHHGTRRTLETLITTLLVSDQPSLAGGCRFCFRVRTDEVSHSHLTKGICKCQVQYGILSLCSSQAGCLLYCVFSALLATCRALPDGRQRRGTPKAGRRRVGPSRPQKALLDSSIRCKYDCVSRCRVTAPSTLTLQSGASERLSPVRDTTGTLGEQGSVVCFTSHIRCKLRSLSRS